MAPEIRPPIEENANMPAYTIRLIETREIELIVEGRGSEAAWRLLTVKRTPMIEGRSQQGTSCTRGYMLFRQKWGRS